jgi:hypothetical protein
MYFLQQTNSDWRGFDGATLPAQEAADLLQQQAPLHQR